MNSASTSSTSAEKAGRDLGSDMNEEMRSHLEMQTRENVEAGMTTDAFTHAVVSTGLAGSALLACWLPARRAARVDPMVFLRED